MRNWQRDVQKFHEKFGAVIGNINDPVDPVLTKLRKDLIEEEHMELQHALDTGVYEHIAKEAADLIYVILGTMVSYGIDINPIWDAVQESNMNKEGGSKRSDGKVMKPEGWKPPDIKGILEVQRMLNTDSPFSDDLTEERIQFHEYQFKMLEEIAKADQELESKN